MCFLNSHHADLVQIRDISRLNKKMQNNTNKILLCFSYKHKNIVLSEDNENASF